MVDVMSLEELLAEHILNDDHQYCATPLDSVNY